MTAEPVFDASSPTVKKEQRLVAQSFSSYLSFDMMLPFIEFFASIQKLDTSKKVTSNYILDWKEFFSIPLIYLRQLLTSLSACFMSQRTSTSKHTSIQKYKKEHKTKYMLHVAYLKPKELLGVEDTPMIDELAKDIHKLFVSVFDTFTEDEKRV